MAINRSSDIVSGELTNLRLIESTPKQYERIKRLKENIRNILTQLSIIGGYLANTDRNEIQSFCDRGAELTSYQKRGDLLQNAETIDVWASRANNLIIDYSGSKFKIISGLDKGMFDVSTGRWIEK